MKKISALILTLVIALNFFCFVNFAQAAEYKTCCVCSVTKTYSGGAGGAEVVTTKEAFTDLKDAEQCAAKEDELGGLGKTVVCHVSQNIECGSEAKIMTDLEEDFALHLQRNWT